MITRRTDMARATINTFYISAELNILKNMSSRRTFMKSRNFASDFDTSWFLKTCSLFKSCNLIARHFTSYYLILSYLIALLWLHTFFIFIKVTRFNRTTSVTRFQHNWRNKNIIESDLTFTNLIRNIVLQN